MRNIQVWHTNSEDVDSGRRLMRMGTNQCHQVLLLVQSYQTLENLSQAHSLWPSDQKYVSSIISYSIKQYKKTDRSIALDKSGSYVAPGYLTPNFICSGNKDCIRELTCYHKHIPESLDSEESCQNRPSSSNLTCNAASRFRYFCSFIG